MKAIAILHGLRATALALLAGLLLSAAPGHAVAAGHFGGGGGHFGGFHGGYGGFHGGYGFRGGCCWRGGFGWGGWWGWPGYGLFLATLPLYYSTLWWDGVPYYYADDSYYVYNAAAGGYMAVAPPPQIAGQAGAPQAGPPGSPAPQQSSGELFAYPKNSQSAEQQERDKQECRSWAASQAGAPSAQNRSDNLRAQTACLEARGYSVR